MQTERVTFLITPAHKAALTACAAARPCRSGDMSGARSMTTTTLTPEQEAELAALVAQVNARAAGDGRHARRDEPRRCGRRTAMSIGCSARCGARWSGLSDAFAALKNVMLMQERMDTVRADIGRTSADVQIADRQRSCTRVDSRVARIEGMIEMSRS